MVLPHKYNVLLPPRFSSASGPGGHRLSETEMSGGSYFVSDSGRVTGHDDSYSNIFAQQRAAIDEALAFARKKNNILVQLDFGSVDLVLPSKVQSAVVIVSFST
jgi:hypothetical protein